MTCTRPALMLAWMLILLAAIFALIVVLEGSQPINTTTATSLRRPPPPNNDGSSSNSADEGTSLLWSDEFDGDELNQDYWSCDSVQTVVHHQHPPQHQEQSDDLSTTMVEDVPLDPVGTGLEFYDPHAISVKDGMLTISTQRVINAGVPFVSGRIKTQDKILFQYGTVEARIRIRSSCKQGVDVCVGALNLSPSFWTRGSGSTSYGEPTMGQVDIFSAALPKVTRRRRATRTLKEELADGTHSRLMGIIHRRTSSLASTIDKLEEINVTMEESGRPWMGHSGASWIPPLSAANDGNGHIIKKSFYNDFPIENWMDQDFQIYKMEWTPTRMATYIDDELIWEMDITDGSCGDCQDFHRPHFLLLAISVLDSPSWASSSTSSTMDLSVDYIHLFDNGFAKVSRQLETRQ